MTPPEPFQLVREDAADPITFVVLSGDADRFRADEVGTAIAAARDDGRTVAVEISGATFMDSSMISTLVAASEQARRRGERFVIVCANQRLRRSLQLKGLETILDVVDDRDEAVSLIGGDDAPPGDRGA